MDKHCKGCGKTQPLSDFYKHSRMADGHLNYCKACVKARVAKHREANLERVRAYDRERAKLPERIKAATRVSEAWRAEDRRRAKCHNAVARAIRAGRLAPQPCKVCGAQKSVAHHDDYNKPLEVRWLCQPCHKAHHKNTAASR